MVQTLEQQAQEVVCIDCGHSVPENKAYKTRHNTYVCKDGCLSEYLDSDTDYK